MKKIILILISLCLLSLVSCSKITREEPVFKYVNAEVESCKVADEGHYEVTLLLENGEKFTYHSYKDLNNIKEETLVNMGYKMEEKATFIACINP